jgi:hypothetical protein
VHHRPAGNLAIGQFSFARVLRKIDFPYLYDPTQQVGRNCGATCTPHAFILNKDRKLAYMGAIDDNMHSDKVEKNYVRKALDSLLSGKKPDTAVTRQFGCGIQYE